MIAKCRLEALLLASFLLGASNLSLFGIIPIPASAVTLAWNSSTDPSVAGYRLYEGGESQIYTNMMDVGAATVAWVSGLASSGTYYFAVTAYDTNGVESPFSGEISYTVPVPLSVAPNSPLTNSTAGPSDLPSLRMAYADAKRIIVNGSGPPGSVYEVWVTQDLSSWSMVGSITADASGSFQFADSVNVSMPMLFYQLRRRAAPPAAP